MPKKILIIEDDQYLSEMYKMKFESEGYQIIITDSGIQGIELAKQEQPDLILLDLVLPKIDGYQILNRLRKDVKTKKLKVYILSNLGQDNEISRGLKCGADGYFVKSDLTPRQLINKVEQIFNK